MNHKKIQRLWREEGLRVPQRRRRKRHGTSTAPDTVIADAPNRVWAVDFQFDFTTDGRPIKIVSIVDEHTRECLGGMVERSITGEHLIGELDRLAGERGTYPAVLRCDNGPELACSAMADWVDRAGRVALHPARRAVAQRLRRIVQLPHPRRMPEHQQLLVAGPSPGGHQRLETRLQPPPPALIAGLPTPSPLRRHLYPPMNDPSHRPAKSRDSRLAVRDKIRDISTCANRARERADSACLVFLKTRRRKGGQLPSVACC